MGTGKAAMVKMGDVWDRTVEFLGDNLPEILPIALFAIFLPTSISGSLEGLQATAGRGPAIALGVLSVGLAIIQLWGQLAIAALAIDGGIGRHAGRVATARLLPAIGVYLILFVALFLLFVPAVAILVAGGVDLTALGAGDSALQQAAPGTIGIAATYMIAMAVVALFVAARLIVLTPVIVAERRGVGAFGSSFALTRGLTWKIVGVLILFAIVAIVAILAAQTVFGSILGLIAGGDGPVTVASVITAVVVAAVTTAFTVLASAFTAKLYVAVVRVRDAVAAPDASA